MVSQRAFLSPTAVLTEVIHLHTITAMHTLRTSPKQTTYRVVLLAVSAHSVADILC
ncbi:hypothetical protein ACEZCY_29120 [Streptacidiphilus sp. N1-12]|uniref:Uncharacterized protein n=2 Tax=Streptacidiphilus alkalitolerans TaxID=3342712 RepID=A0ABV6VHH7_9ACTN